MKILRWLLSHTVLILLIVAVIYGYMFWGNLAGEDTPAGKAIAYLSSEFDEVGEFVAAVKAKQAALKPSTIKPPAVGINDEPEPVVAAIEIKADDMAEQPVYVADSSRQAEPGRAVAEVAASGPDAALQNDQAARSVDNESSRHIERQPVSISYSHNHKRIVQNEAGIIETAIEPDKKAVLAAVQTPAVVKNTSVKRHADNNRPSAAKVVTSDKFVPTEIKKQLDNVDEHGKVRSNPQQDGKIRADWIVARKSFYQRNYSLSEKKYKDVIENTEDNYDAYGELGNVYFNQGKKKQAASAYFEAAAILIRQGQISRARSLIGLLRHLDKSKASELQKLIDSNLS